MYSSYRLFRSQLPLLPQTLGNLNPGPGMLLCNFSSSDNQQRETAATKRLPLRMPRRGLLLTGSWVFLLSSTLMFSILESSGNKSTMNAPVSTLGILNVNSTSGNLFRTFSLAQSQDLLILLDIDYFCCALHANYLHHHTVN